MVLASVLTRLTLLQLHQRMKADAEWSAIETKVHGADADYKVS